MPPWMLVTPASRGIGLVLAQRLLATTTLPLVATARKDLDQTREAILTGADSKVDESRLHVLKVDVTQEDTIEAAAAQCRDLFSASSNSSSVSKDGQAGSHLHAAFLLPGILHPEKAPGQMDADKVLETFRVNTIGPMLMLKHLAPFLPRKSPSAGSSSSSSSNNNNDYTELQQEQVGDALPTDHATVLVNSARVGSITDNQTVGGWYSYRASKAAVNQVVRTFDNYLRTAGGANALALAYHPGTVKTELSRPFWDSIKAEKLFTPEYAVGKMLEVVKSTQGQADKFRGRCWDWKGEEVLP